MLILPFEPTITPYRFTCPIGDSPYHFDVRWNGWNAAWYFDLREIDETPIARGIKIVIGTYLGRKFSHPLFADGVFIAHDVSGARKDPGLDDLGTRVPVMYASNDEVIAAQVSLFADIRRGVRR